MKYGSNLSPFSSVNADPSGFDKETLDAVLFAMNSVPEHLREATMKDTGFYRFSKGETLAKYAYDNVIADAYGAVFDGIDNYNFNEKVATITHELGHRSAYLNKNNLDESAAWENASGWQTGADEKPFNNRMTGWVSDYAKTNPREDYAETYTLYRFNPRRLKQVSPERYQFMKEQVFKGIEYDQNICQGQINTEATSAESPENTEVAR